jgi:hypothetical protein
MITDANIYKFSWEFVEQALLQFDPKNTVDQELLLLNQLIRDNNRYNEFRVDAIRKGVSFQEYIEQKIRERGGK